MTSGLYTLFTADASDPTAGGRANTALLDQDGSGAYDVMVDTIGSPHVSTVSGVWEVSGSTMSKLPGVPDSVTFTHLGSGNSPGVHFGTLDGPTVLYGDGPMLVNIDSGATFPLNGPARALLYANKTTVPYLDDDGLSVFAPLPIASSSLSYNVDPNQATDFARDSVTATYYVTEVDPGLDVIRVVKLEQGVGTSTVTVIPNPDDQPSHIAFYDGHLFVSRTKGTAATGYATTIFQVLADGSASLALAGGDTNASFLCATDDNVTPSAGRIGAVTGLAVARNGSALYITEHSVKTGNYTYGRVRKLDLNLP